MEIRFIDPFIRAWERMKTALFKPVDMNKWFVVGFTAFLSELIDFGSNAGSGGNIDRDFNWHDILFFPQEAWEWLQENPGWFVLISMALCLLIILGIILTWISARGKFMFLDNVIHDRALVRKPWHEFRKVGDSLFSWRIVFDLLVLVCFILYLVYCFSYLYDLYRAGEDESVLLLPAIWMVIGMVVLFLIEGFIHLLLSDFITPMMYKYRIGTNEGWRMFLPLLSTQFIYFLGYALLVLAVMLVVGIGIIIVGFLTCCCGFVILIIPYINSVVLLPISYTLRAYSIEFLEQFGPEYQIFPRSEHGPGTAILSSS
jgi:hypothetical protein